MAAAALEYMVGALTAVCTSLVVVLMLWRLSRMRARPPPPPSCDVTDVLAWLLDAGHAATGAAILALVAGSGGVTCAVAGFTALLAGAQTLGVLAARAVVMTTGHVVRSGSRDAKARGDAADGRRCGWSAAALIGVQLCVVTVLCALPLSRKLPIAATWTATTAAPPQQHLACVPLASHSQHAGTPAAWRYSCFLVVAVCWLPLVVAAAAGVVRQRRAPQHPGSAPPPISAWSSWVALGWWAVVALLLSVELLATRGDSAALQVALALALDLATLTHVVQHVLDATQCCRHHRVSPARHHQHCQCPPARLTAVSRATPHLVILAQHTTSSTHRTSLNRVPALLQAVREECHLCRVAGNTM